MSHIHSGTTIQATSRPLLLVAFVVGILQTADAATVSVKTTTELQNAISSANSSGGNTTILLRDGSYTLADTLYVNAPNVTISSESGIRDNVIIQGDAMSSTARVKNLIRVAGSGFQISNLTLQKSGWHLLQIVGELNADNAVIRNVVFRDAYEQMLKVSIDQSNYSVTADNGIIEKSLFEYSAGKGPQYYIGGVDIHGGKRWTVRKNTFRSIISPSQSVAEFAIHVWNQSADALVEKNLIIDCDRAIGFGLDGRGNNRGIIRNNMIHHSATAGSFADVGVYLEQSPGTQVYNNTIYQEHDYPNSIEYRFTETRDVFIANNLSNKPILARDGATGTLFSNVVTASASWFADVKAGNLRLRQTNTTVVDKGRMISGLTDDIDDESRPQGSAIDVGADEWSSAIADLPVPTNLRLP